MRDHPHIVLIGMMASGKTTVGRLLAAQLDRPLVDLDSALVESIGISIADAFDAHGEEWFRAQETAMLLDVLSNESPQIISPGGGIVLAVENRAALKQHALCVWLRASPETILRRVGTGTSRPLLAGNTEERVRRINAERGALYAEVANAVIDVDDLTSPQVVECVRAAFREAC